MSRTQAEAYDLFGTTLDDLERASLTFLDKAIEYYKPAKVWALYSGGTDSTATALLASKHPAFSGVLHMDTETGIAETQEHVIRVCEARGWDLTIEPPKTTGYERLVTQFGFLGRGQHNIAYAHLKDRALGRVTAKKRAGGGVLMVSGVRTQESARRMANSNLVTEDGHRTWVAPILHWSKQATKDYAAREGVPENPVSKKLGMSGECLCGCFARPGERDLLRKFYPQWDEWCSWMEAKVDAAGKWAHWGIQRPRNVKGFEASPQMITVAEQVDPQLCSDCIRRGA